MTLTYVLAVLLMLLIIMHWVWRYRIKTYFAKMALETSWKNHPEWKRFKKTEHFLNQLYRDIQPTFVSLKERNRLKLEEDVYTYGEIEFLPFLTLLETVKPKPGEVFYDLGSGAGRAVFTAGLTYPFSKACGIEFLPGLHELAVSRIEIAKRLTNHYPDSSLVVGIEIIQFIQDNFLEYDFSDADVVYVSATCFSYPFWEKTIEKLKMLKKGSRIMVATKRIRDDEFELIAESVKLMSWGVNSVNVYRRK